MNENQKKSIIEQIGSIRSEGEQKRKQISDDKEMFLSEIKTWVTENIVQEESFVPVISVEREALLKEFSNAAKCGDVQKMSEIKEKLLTL